MYNPLFILEPRHDLYIRIPVITNHLKPIKKIPVFKVTLDFFSGFQEKNIILCILKGETPFKMHKSILFYNKKKNRQKYVCLPYLKFSDLLPETHLFFYLAL